MYFSLVALIFLHIVIFQAVKKIRNTESSVSHRWWRWLDSGVGCLVSLQTHTWRFHGDEIHAASGGSWAHMQNEGEVMQQ